MVPKCRIIPALGMLHLLESDVGMVKYPLCWLSGFTAIAPIHMQKTRPGGNGSKYYEITNDYKDSLLNGNWRKCIKMTFLKSVMDVFYNFVTTWVESDALRKRPLPDGHQVIMLNSK